jgi:hypothetical protein
MFFFNRRRPKTTGTGIGLKAGDDHYRAFVGPPEDYDRVAAMAFNLLTCIGLRQQHRVLDVGCGSLRIGRLLIPYLDKGNYLGIEPNRWLVTDGILNEVGQDQIRIKAPRFFYRASLAGCGENLRLEYALAQSIFSHCALPLVRDWLAHLSAHLRDEGALLATFCCGTEDFDGNGWIYPACVSYRPETLAALAGEAGFAFEVLNWRHPRQAWALFAKPHYDRSLVSGGVISWNRVMEQR